MTEHPITPPPELVDEWRRAPEYTDGLRKLTMVTITVDRLQYIATRAAQWGADQELEACCEWLVAHQWHGPSGACLVNLRAARRPKPLSLKQQALEAVKQIPVEPNGGPWCAAMETIIRALETLND
jgi:hypothetical protein